MCFFMKSPVYLYFHSLLDALAHILLVEKWEQNGDKFGDLNDNYIQIVS